MRVVRIGLYTWGSEGDVRPFVALAAGLVRAGHEADLGYVAIDGRDWTSTCAPLGIRSRAIAVDAVARARTAPGPLMDAMVGKGNALSQVKSVIEGLLDPVVEDLWADARRTIEDVDVAVVHLLAHPALTAAIARGVPLATVQPAPVTPTRYLPPMGAPDLGPLNALSWWLADRFSRSWLVPRFNVFRARAGLPPLTRMLGGEDPAIALGLTCVSPSLVERPADWHPSQHVTGFFDLPPGAHAWAPPAELEAFLGAGEAPVLMSLGSMLAMPGEETSYCVRAMIEAAELAGCRAIIQAPWAELPELPSPASVLRLGRAPHDVLLAGCRAMVHHGGAGTTQAACLAGKPSVVVPFLGDQFFWADRLRRLGIAPASAPRKRLTARSLARRLRELLADRDAPAKAREIAASMRREDGVARAVALLEAVRR